MLLQELPLLESRPVDGISRWLVPAIAAAAAITGAGILWAAGATTAAILFLIVSAVALPAAVYLRRQPETGAPDLGGLVAAPDYPLVGSVLGLVGDCAALTDSDGTLLTANIAYRERFTARGPDKLPADEDSRQALSTARTMAWRDGGGCAAGIVTESGTFAVEIERVGARSDLLLWRFLKPAPTDPVAVATSRLRGRAGDLLGAAGVLAALVDEDGKLLSWNKLFGSRALTGNSAESPPLSELVKAGEGDG